MDERTEAVYKERFMRDRRTSADGAFDGLVSNLRLYGKNEVPQSKTSAFFKSLLTHDRVFFLLLVPGSKEVIRRGHDAIP